MAETLTIAFQVLPDGFSGIVSGRDAWALDELHRAGNRGVTAIDNPGPRWSAYVFNLRKMGLTIETVHETHKGPFPGTHARYVLRNDILIERCADGAAA